MADINDKLNQTKNNLKNVEAQAKKTEEAVRKVSEAENEAAMHEALRRAEIYAKPEKNIKKKTEEIKEQTKEVEVQPEVKVKPQFEIDNDYKDNLKKVIEKYNFQNDAQFFEAHKYLGQVMGVENGTTTDYSIESFKQYLDSFINQSEAEINKRFAGFKDHFGKEYMEVIRDVFNGKIAAPLFSTGYYTVNREIDSKLGYFTHYYNHVEDINKVNDVINNANKNGYQATAEDIKKAEETIGEFLPKVDISKKRIMELAEVIHNFGGSIIYSYRDWNYVKNMMVPVTDKDIDAAKNELNKIIEAYKNMLNSLDGKTFDSFKKDLERQIEQYKNKIEQLNNKHNLPNTKYAFYNQESARTYKKSAYENSDYAIRNLQQSFNREIERQDNIAKKRAKILGKYEKVSTDEGLVEALSNLKAKNEVVEYIRNAVLAHMKGLIEKEPFGVFKLLNVKDFEVKNPISEGKYYWSSTYTTQKERNNANLLKQLDTINKFSNDAAISAVKNFKPHYDEDFFKSLGYNEEQQKKFIERRTFKPDDIDKMMAKSKEYSELLKNNVQQQVSQVTETVKSAVKPTEDAVKTITDNVTKQVDDASKQVEDTVKNTVEYISNTINGFTLVGGIADELKKQFALIPMGKPYIKGNGFNMFEPDPKQLPAIRKSAELATYDNSVIDAEYREIDVLKNKADAENDVAETTKKAQKEQADAEKAAADAAKKAKKEQADAQKALEERLNNLKSKVKTVTDAVKSSISTVISIIRKANSIVNKFLTTTITGFEKFGSTVKRLISIFGNFGNRVTNFNKQGNILKGTFTELKSKIDLVVGAFSKLFNNSLISEGRNLLSSIQTLNMLIGTDLTDRTIEWANNLERGFGLSANNLITDLRGITSVMYGLGMQFDHTQKAATNLEAIALGLSATTGYDFETVIGKIESGMKGMTQSIDDLGLSVRESQMDAFLKKLKAQGGEYANINTHFSQLAENQRVYVRLAAIMDQYMSKEAFTAENYAKSLDTITGRLSILGSQMRGLKSDIGNLALQLFDRIIDKLIVVISLVRQFIGWLAKLFNIDLSLNSQMNKGQRNDIKPIEDKTDALEKEADAADKAKGSLDSLDHVSTMTESKSSKNKDGSDFDYSKLIDFDDYAGLLEQMAKEQDNYIDKLKKKWKDAFTDLIKQLTGRDIDWSFIKGNLDKVKRNIENTIKNIGKIVKNFGKILLGLIWSIGDDLDFSVLLAKFTRVISLFTQLVATILEKIQPYIQKFYDKYLSPYVQKFGDWCEKYLDKAIVKLSEWIAWWENDGNNPAIQAWFDNLGKKFEELVKWIGYIKTIFKGLFGMEENEKDLENLKNMPEWFKNIHDIMVDVNSIFRDFLGILGDVLVHIFDFNDDGKLTFADVKVAIEKIKDKLDEVAQWVNDNKKNITIILSEAWDTLSKLAELKFTIIEQLIKTIVENADKVKAVLDTIQEVLKFCIEHPKLSIALAIGLTIAGKVLSGVATAVFWQTVLGIGPGGALASALGSVGASLAVIAAPIAVIIAMMAVLVGLFATAYSQSEEFRNKVHEKVEELGKFIDKHLERIKELFDDIKVKLKDIGLDLDDIYANPIIKFILDKTLESLIAGIKGQLDLILIPLESILQTIDDMVKLIDDLKNMNIKEIFGDLQNLGTDFMGGGFFKSVGKEVGNAIFGADTEEAENIANDVGTVDKAVSKLGDTTEKTSTQYSDSWGSIIGKTSEANSSISETLNSNVAKLDETILKTDELKNNTQTNWDEIKGVYTTSTDEINGKTDEVTNKITESMSTMNTLTGESLNTFNQTNFKTWEDVVAETSKASTEIKGKTNEVKFNVTNMSLGVKSCIPNITSFTSAFMSSFSALNDSVYRICEGINQKIGNMFQNVVNQTNNANNIAQQMHDNNNTNTNWNPNRVRNFGYANGGTPKSGSIFYANENGNTELVGNFGGYSGVANQGMIIQAMQGAMVNAIKSSGGFNGGQTPNITINVGTWMGDEAGIRKLAREVQNSINKSNSTIANTSFSMS